MLQLRSRLLFVAIIMLSARLLRAQEVGTIASLEGQAEVGHDGAWQAASIGAAIHERDELRTGTPGRLRIVFQDDSVVTVSDNSHIVIDEQVFDPNRGVARSLIELLRGKLSSLVGEYSHGTGSKYEVKTPTAVCGVRGTEFVITYNADTDVTEVVGLSGQVEVHSVFDPTGPGVLVTMHETTTVLHNRPPTPPRRAEDTMFRQRLEGIQFVGGGKTESLLSGNPLRAGTSVTSSERAPAGVAGANAPGQSPNQHHDASNLLGGAPSIIKATTGQVGIVFPH
jgi:hypothetical protein